MSNGELVKKSIDTRGNTARANKIDIIKALNSPDKLVRETVAVDRLQALVDLVNSQYLTSFRLKLVMDEEDVD